MEIMAAIRSFNSLEAGAAWSPTGRLLVAGEAAFQTSESSITSSNSTSYRWGIVVGPYQPQNPSNEKLAPYSSLISIGAGLRPHLLRRHQLKVSE